MSDVVTALLPLLGVLLGVGVTVYVQRRREQQYARDAYIDNLSLLQDAIAEFVTCVIKIRTRQITSYRSGHSVTGWPPLEPTEIADGFIARAKVEVLASRVHDPDIRQDVNELILQAGSIASAASLEKSTAAQEKVKALFPRLIERIGGDVRSIRMSK